MFGHPCSEKVPPVRMGKCLRTSWQTILIYCGSRGYPLKGNPKAGVHRNFPPGTWVQYQSPVRAGELSCILTGIMAVAGWWEKQESWFICSCSIHIGACPGVGCITRRPAWAEGKERATSGMGGGWCQSHIAVRGRQTLIKLARGESPWSGSLEEHPAASSRAPGEVVGRRSPRMFSLS